MTTLLLLLSCTGSWADPRRELGPPVAEDAPLHPSVELLPAHVGVVNTERRDIHGAPIGVPCATCHSKAEGGTPMVEGEGEPVNFHTGVDLKHGSLGCSHCHSVDRSLLHLADGTEIAIREVTQLCTQCHGPQARDYKQGLHGGKAGYWDQSRGPVQRNACVVCHAPHEPAYGAVVPTFEPKDRFMPTEAPPEAAH
ncbi:MAG TPA: hypothetical protein PKW90_21545, partial [Myxococcota bacterium]|nr:hypothetical protein [Myxococcota bacterium]